MDGRLPSWVVELQKLADVSTPGPWHVGAADDTSSASAGYVATEKVPGHGWPSSDKVVAITFLQTPGFAMPEREEENADFIAAAREGVPRLCDEVKRLIDQRDRLRASLSKFVSGARGTSHGRAEVGQELIDEARAVVAELDAG
jgi:hypothetical protein